mmetsp:Transcript_11817/g.22050  ORF Transcript_11817/g.22050 Transcript_11817/m.22050 type:complete len:337 (+) Transcript_11817:164-1174(+)
MIDFDELDEVDVNVRLQDVLEDEPVPEKIARVKDGVDEGDGPWGEQFGVREEDWKRAEEPRGVLKAAAAHVVPNTILAILVPYRDDAKRQRSRQLQQFVQHFSTQFLPMLPPSVELRVVILEQTRGGAFNRGKLLNMGALWCKAFHSERTVLLCPHDVDMLPNPALMPYYCHYEEGQSVHIGWINRKYDYPNFFGGICTVPMTDFFSAGGFPNDFWGWGREDDVLHARLLLLSRGCVLLPEAVDGIRFLDKEQPCREGDSPNVIHLLNLLGADNIFDRPSFSVLDSGEEKWLCHLLLDLKPPSAEAEPGPREVGSSVALVQKLLSQSTEADMEHLD